MQAARQFEIEVAGLVHRESASWTHELRSCARRASLAILLPDVSDNHCCGPQEQIAAMLNAKPNPLIAAQPRQVCPVCGCNSYSYGGIHPQCAMREADEVRLKRTSRKAGRPKRQG